MFLTLSKILFFFLFIFTPLAFGTTESWSYAIMETATGTACLLFFISILNHKQNFYKVPGLIPLVIFLFYILFQLVPLPPPVVKFLSPGAFLIHQTTNMLADTSSWMTISINQKATLSEFFRYTTYVMFYVFTVQMLVKKETFQSTVIVIAVFGGLLAFSSILQFYLTEDMALWFRYSPTNSIVVGPYVNHNHYAGLMELIFPVVLGLFLFYRPRIGHTSLIKGVIEILNQEKANIHILIGASALLIVISIFVSLSRGAMISTCFSLLLFTFFLVNRKISKGNTLVIIGIIMLTALSIGWFGWDQIFERFAKLKNAQGIIYESRLDFWKDTLKIIRHYFFTGAGIGTFSHIYPLYRTVTMKNFLTHAHNDYLELLAEGGIIGFLLAASFLLTFFYQTYRVFLKRRDAFSIYLYIGCITAMVSILLHSFTDFNMHIGANGLWFFFVAGIAVSSANTGMRKNSKKTRLPEINSFNKKLSLCFIISVTAIFMTVYNISNLLGIFYYSNIKNYRMSINTPPSIIKKIEKVADFASRFDPLVADYPFTKANTAWFSSELKKARSLFITSIYLDPVSSMHLNRFATFLAKQGDTNKAETAFKKSMIYDQSNAEYIFQYAAWLFAEHNSKKALEYMKKTLEFDQKYVDRVLTAMVVAGVNVHQMEKAIPDMPGPSIAFAQFLYDTGDIEGAIDRYLEALDLIENNKTNPSYSQERQNHITRTLFFKVFWFFKNHNDIKNAMQVMERAEKNLPMDARIKVMLGDLYYQQGILYKAREKYDHALLLDPGNRKAFKMMKKINL